MKGGAITLVVSGPVPGSVRSDAESASALLRELHARTILHVARPAESDPDRAENTPDHGPDLPVGGGRKGGPVDSLAELVVTGLFSATTVTALASVAVAFIRRGAARRITIRDGRRTLTISDPSERTERVVAEWLGVPPARGGAGSGAD